ncbi:hypothetical protein HYPSUDRAFT_202762 [Hypholoma sublateritium FD-334 SS-4]|uniref:Uncharacterized protein n=1 Tax=Hypholoma sublateritium (strain FD-334 SS-4) TaxID=945553 RepID=A0A0D2MDP4_HYPSF|nr:hypothetical protein HYPSUDRAFT_202762 [Hypholoma sublateritium FD-334 SS-4]
MVWLVKVVPRQAIGVSSVPHHFTGSRVLLYFTIFGISDYAGPQLKSRPLRSQLISLSRFGMACTTVGPTATLKTH